MYRFQFNAYQIHHRKQWYRFITHGFLHGDWAHLIINMIVLLSFGQFVEACFYNEFGNNAPWVFLGLYFSSLVVSSISSYVKHRDNASYNAIGASGAVSAVVFSSIVFGPFNEIRLYGIIPLPSIVWGVIYVAYSIYSSKNANDNIGHEAHLWGAAYGLVFTLLLDSSIANNFFGQIMDRF